VTDVPFFTLNRFELIALEPGVATAAIEVTPWLAGTAELGIPAGALAFADCLLSYAASSMHSGMNTMTLGLRVELWRAPPPMGARLAGSASVMPAEGPALLVRGDIDADGVTVASATLRSLTAPRAVPTRRQDARPSASVDLVALPAGAWAPPAGLIDHVLELPAAAVAGLECVRVGDGVVELTTTPGPELSRTEGTVHGGATPVIGELGCAAALASAFNRVRFRRLDVSVDYLRPTLIGQPAVVRARVVHRGRRVVKTHAEIVNADGKATARIYETSVIADD
jgi:uncharacterized protein (TIGR00369 family)